MGANLSLFLGAETLKIHGEARGEMKSVVERVIATLPLEGS